MPQRDVTTANIFPSLTYDDAPRAIEFLCTAFGFTKKLVVTGPKGSIRHSELYFEGGVVMVSSPRPQEKRIGPRSSSGISQALSVRVSDPDGHCARARAAGAVVVREVQDEPYGSRGYMAEDIEGRSWYFGTYLPGAYWSADGPAIVAEP
jgi:uncharacterized glyoxalase superfamily protein PhnB